MKAAVAVVAVTFALGLPAAASGQAAPGGPALSDLEVYAVGLAESGAVIYQVANRGNAGTDRPFLVDVYVDGVRRDSISHPALPALTVQTAQSNLARLTECKAAMVRIVLDPQNGVREASKTNNERSVQLLPVCARQGR
ncbi:MAG TPA: CARDB domain-containing protein [Candidatus Binatia bacterium]|nr:CARDB domain-containing protein [Candidatus Binatia bacterium]